MAGTLRWGKMIVSLSIRCLLCHMLLGLLMLAPCPSSSLPLCTDLSESLFHTCPSFAFA